MGAYAILDLQEYDNMTKKIEELQAYYDNNIVYMEDIQKQNPQIDFDAMANVPVANTLLDGCLNTCPNCGFKIQGADIDEESIRIYISPNCHRKIYTSKIQK